MRLLERVLRLHEALKWCGACVCWAEKPEMRGSRNERVGAAPPVADAVSEWKPPALEVHAVESYD